MKRSALILAMLIGIGVGRNADAKSYTPLQAVPTTQYFTRSIKVEDRPFLPGMRPKGVELLEDTLRRKQPRTIGDSRSKAHDSIIRNAFRGPAKRSHMKGVLAEAMYLDKNPAWGYVKSPNAPQHDIYTWVNGRRTPFTGQIKTHVSADPTRYARDMLSDHRSNLFLVPDDHAAALKDHWNGKIRAAEAQGLTANAVEGRRQLARIRGLGFTSQDLDGELSRSAKYCIRERTASYVSLGCATAVALGPGLWELMQTGSVSNKTFHSYVRAGSTIAAERAATYALGKFGMAAGGLRGNAIVGGVILVVDTCFSIYENGGAQAFRNPEFYTRFGGTVGALTLGYTVGAPVFGWVTVAAIPETGPLAPVVGAGAAAVAGAAAGAVGYFGGESATRTILEKINPAFLCDEENKQIAETRQRLLSSIEQLSHWAPDSQAPHPL